MKAPTINYRICVIYLILVFGEMVSDTTLKMGYALVEVDYLIFSLMCDNYHSSEINLHLNFFSDILAQAKTTT